MQELVETCAQSKPGVAVIKQQLLILNHLIPKAFPEPVEPSTCPYGPDKCRYSHDIESALKAKSSDINGDCPILKLRGYCESGVLCRWANSHRPELANINHESMNAISVNVNSANNLNSSLVNSLRKKTFEYSLSKPVISAINDYIQKAGRKSFLGHVTDEDIIKLRACEKKQVDFKNKLYLTPLTTLGNLPFRRICKRFGADVTCGEMALATNLLQGKQSEWALLRRHSTENIFGVQICGSHRDNMIRCADLINQTCEVDFIDINCGCPIDLIYKKGAGCGLLRMDGRLESMVLGMNSVTRTPITIKMRTGIHQSANDSYLLIPSLKRAGVSLFTVHGRSREQRYTGLADWDYVKKCVDLADPVPVYGNGDVLTYEDYLKSKERSGCSGIAIARGALIKPWIFTEIHEARTWDISSSERFDILRDFVNYGLEVWGSDTRGVETTRRFLLEWLSFLHRYIPYGILERVPQRINEKPPAYFCRNDLETMMTSPDISEWIKISELLLGKVPEHFRFFPKHIANSYSG